MFRSLAQGARISKVVAVNQFCNVSWKSRESNVNVYICQYIFAKTKGFFIDFFFFLFSSTYPKHFFESTSESRFSANISLSTTRFEGKDKNIANKSRSQCSRLVNLVNPLSCRTNALPRSF